MPVDSFRSHLDFIYGPEQGQVLADAVQAKIARFHAGGHRSGVPPLDQSDAILITYGDQFTRENHPPLETLEEFSERYLQGIVSGIHILPFFPYSSDDGFSVIDYCQVNPRLGDWSHIERIAGRFRLMVDAVLNHCSKEHAWFQGFLKGEPRYQDYFITVDPQQDLSQVVRPRALPLLTRFETHLGVRYVWTTFSADQVDLNYADPNMLLEMVDILLDYLGHGAQVIRLDAIAYLWKQIGTTCIHLPQTHHMVQIFRQLLDQAAPGACLITETNVPHQDNIAYFGDGYNEAQLVYNFALPPLTMHALQTGNGQALTRWAERLDLPSPQTTFFNFLASHDGVGLNPARGLLSEAEIEAMIAQVERNGGLVSYKTNPDGSESAYELNINYLDALNDPDRPDGLALGEARFMVAQAIMLALRGLPGIYVHSLIGSRSWKEGVAQTGFKRTINRQKFAADAVWSALESLDNTRGRVYQGYARLLRARAATPAFDPYGDQSVLNLHPGCLVLVRQSGASQAVCCFNLRNEVISLLLPAYPGRWHDVLATAPSGVDLDFPQELKLQPYQVVWLVNENSR